MESYTAGLFWRRDYLGWDEILKRDRVVILGEPGSGKSWELRERTRRINSEGAFAFFVRLDQLARSDLRDIVGSEEREGFSQWSQGRTVAYFFLDSVDEAKFRSISDFHTSLNRFRNGLGPDLLLRSKIFLSSRITEWKPLADGFEFQRLFPLPPNETHTDQPGNVNRPQHQDQEVVVVQLEPLDRGQVERLALSIGATNVKAFVDALDRAFAWEFARRPLDVVDLVGFWNTNDRIGSLTEVIEFDISSKLRPRTDRDEFPLSEAEAHEGAEWLAAATIFCRSFSFRVPDEGATNFDSLDPRACLPSHWRDEQVRALLNRAIFDSAVYGRFRFHHRRIGEYMAANWVADRMQHGCPPYELEQLLTDDIRGCRVLRPSMRSVAAWLCCIGGSWNDFVGRLVIEADPGIHLRFGDPSALPIPYRRQILSALAQMSRKQNRLSIEWSPDCLARLADPSLSAEIAAMISDSGLALDFRVALLDLVRYGRIAGCADAALGVLASPGEPEDLKCHAASAIGAVAKPEYDTRLVQLLSGLAHIPHRLCDKGIEALYPRCLSNSQLVELLKKTDPVPLLGIDLPFYLKSRFQAAVTPERAGDLLRHLIVLAKEPPLRVHGQRTLPVSAQFYWIGRPIQTVLKILFQKAVLSEDEITVSAESLQLLGYIREFDHFHRDEPEDLNKATFAHPGVRHAYFWLVVEAFRRENQKEPTMAFELFDHWEVLRLSSDDFSWLLDEIAGTKESSDRLVALHLAIEVWRAAGRRTDNRRRMRRAVGTDALLRRAYRQSPTLSPLFALKGYWWKVRYGVGAKWWWMRKIDIALRRWHWLREQFLLLRKLRVLASGKPTSWLVYLSREADESNNSRWAPSTWSDLEKKRGKWITDAAKRGCVASWRHFTPNLPHQRSRPNETSNGIIVGLTGLQVDFNENPNTFSMLSDSDAKLAMRYAVNELNGFPNWTGVLAASHPNAVGDVLAECVEGEWHFAAGRQETHEILAKLTWQGESLISLAQEKLLALLALGDPQNGAILRYAISALMRQPNPPLDQLATYAAQRTSSETDPARLALWFAVSMHVDGQSAVARLERVVQDSANSDEVVVHLCSILSGEEMERGPFTSNPSYLRAECLRRFIPIVFRHVRISDDINRSEGGAYTPTARDRAQQFRGVLLNRLETDENYAATEALRELASDPAMSQVRDWILNLINKRVLNEADSAPWTPSDLRQFAEQHEVDPKNDRELFAVARKRLQILKWDVEQSDNSLRDELRDGDPEIELRRWLQRKFMERSQRRYTIPQEPEIDQQERPDLRLENPKIAGPISIEVKWANRWTLPQLLERLENQLVGQYLRAHNSRYGIYVLGFIGKKHHWEEPSTGKRLLFADVVGVVKQRAVSLLQSTPKVLGLEVVSIDFRQPKDNEANEGSGELKPL